MTVAEQLEFYEISDERLGLLALGLVEARAEDLPGLLAAAPRYRERWRAAEEGLAQMRCELSTLKDDYEDAHACIGELHETIAELKKKAGAA